MKDFIIPESEALIRHEKQLQSESDWILDRIDLINLLSKYGEVKVVGAKALGLMVAQDIDISVVVPELNITIWQEVVAKLMATKHVRKVTAVDEYNYDEKNVYNPENGKRYSLYIEMDTILGPDQDKHNPWEVQIHLITKDTFDANMLDSIKSKLDDKTRLTILKLKWWANEVNKNLLLESNGHFKIQSTWIYEAVIKYGVSNTDELIAYLRIRIRDKFIGLLSNLH